MHLSLIFTESLCHGQIYGLHSRPAKKHAMSLHDQAYVLESKGISSLPKNFSDDSHALLHTYLIMKRLRLVVAATFSLVLLSYYVLALQYSAVPEVSRDASPQRSSDHDGTVLEYPSRKPHGHVSDNMSQKQAWPSSGPSHETLQNVPPPEIAPSANHYEQALGIPDLPPSGLPSPSTTENNLLVPEPEPEFEFQKDLKLDLPIEIFKSLSRNRPHNYAPNHGLKQRAFATFMASRNPSIKDPYFLAIHSLIYRVLWSPRSRTAIHPFVVFVGQYATPEQRELLAGAGAVVRELAPLEWIPNVPGTQPRWKDLFAKLNMWNETEFSRILFLDADAFPLANIDAMFDLAPENACIEGKMQLDDFLADGTPVCEPYVFAGVPHDPFNKNDIDINVGSMVFSPSEKMHQRLVQNYVKTDKYDCMMAEQAFLNWQFSVNGAFPASSLAREYGAFFPRQDEKGTLKVVHEKIWAAEWDWLREEWQNGWQEMLAFYRSPKFAEERGTDVQSG